MPDGLEVYYTLQGLEGYNHIVYLKSMNGVWQQPEIAPFSNLDHNADPFISPDGKKLFFWSNGPQNGNSDVYWVSAKIIEELRPME